MTAIMGGPLFSRSGGQFLSGRKGSPGARGEAKIGGGGVAMSETGKGRCACGAVVFELLDRPLFVHACHCTWCQRETGSAFVLNALIEARKVRVTSGAPVAVPTPSESGKGQFIFRCPTCQVALWSVYSGAGPKFLFVRSGTLEMPFAPDIHIFTSTKQPWVTLGDGKPVMEEYYRRSDYWPEWALKRRKEEMARSD